MCLVFVSIIQFSDFEWWVMETEKTPKVSNDIFVIKHTCMGPTVSAKSHRALLLTNPPTAPSQSSHQKSTHTKIFHIQPQSSSHTHPQPSQAYRVAPPQPTRASPSSDRPTWCPENLENPNFFYNLSSPRKPRLSTK